MPEGAYARLPCWNGSDSWFDALMDALATPEGEALRKRWIAGAALDVFEREPLGPDDPLWDVPGLIVSPHMSGDTVGWRDELGAQFVELFGLWEAGTPLPNVVDKERGYVPGH